MGWSPDGRFLLYSRNAQPRVIDVETGEHWRLVEDAHQPAPNTDLARALEQWGPTGEASWSPDGSFIVLTMTAEPSFARQWRESRPTPGEAAPMSLSGAE
jgi:Tol biopolymer transport system component